MTLPDFTTPDALASHLGWSPRRVRKLTRDLGVGRILGNRIVLLPEDVVFILKATEPNCTVADFKEWISDDTAEMFKEKESQGWAEPTGEVYFVQRSNEVKIGYSTDLAKRLINFRSASTDTFRVLLQINGTMLLEAYFHEKFASQNVAREWFKYEQPIKEFIARRKHSMGLLP